MKLRPPIKKGFTMLETISHYMSLGLIAIGAIGALATVANLVWTSMSSKVASTDAAE